MCRRVLGVALAASHVVAGSMMNLTVALASNKDTSVLASTISGNAQLAAALSNTPNITFFAASNEAIDRINSSVPLLMKQILSNASLLTAEAHYHMVQGVHWTANFSGTPSFLSTDLDDHKYSNVTGGQAVAIKLLPDAQTQVTTGFKNTAKVVQADIPFSGGVIHIIDSLFSIPDTLESTARAAGLTAFLGALKRTGLIDALADTKDLTVFAPTNAAFEAVGSIFANMSTPDLAHLLAFHVLSTTTYSTGLTNSTHAPTLLPHSAPQITVADDAIFVNDARVVNADILFSNGVIHIIDSVLNPNTSGQAALSIGDKPAVAFQGAKHGSISNLTQKVRPSEATLPALTSSTQRVLAVQPVTIQPSTASNATRSAAVISKRIPNALSNVGLALLAFMLSL